MYFIANYQFDIINHLNAEQKRLQIKEVKERPYKVTFEWKISVCAHIFSVSKNMYFLVLTTKKV